MVDLYILFTIIRLISHLILGLTTTPVDVVTTHSMLQGHEESNYTWTLLKVRTLSTIMSIMTKPTALTRETTFVSILEFRPAVINRSTSMAHIMIIHWLIRQTFFIFTGLQVIPKKDLRAMLKEKGREEIRSGTD